MNKQLWGCSNKGVIYTPSGIAVFWLPRKWAYKLHKWLNNLE